MKNAGYVRLDRKILNWEWYSDANTCRVFLHLILKANWKAGRFKGVDIPRGSIATSITHLAEELKLTIRNVRTAVEHLKTTGELTRSRHAKFTVFTIKNYDLYQSGDRVIDNETTTIEESKNNNKNNYKDIVLQAEPSDSGFVNDPYESVCWDDSSGFAVVLNLDEQVPAKVYGQEPEEPADCLYEETAAYLNKKTGKHFKSTSKLIRKFLKERFCEGFTVEDAKKVIDVKTEEWKGTRMAMYLRPSTLFGDNFEAYLNQEAVHVHADPPREAKKPYSVGTRFNNFTQRETDFVDLERKLLAIDHISGAFVPAMPF